MSVPGPQWDRYVCACPACGADVDEMDTATAVVKEYPQVEVWPGGPEVPATWAPPRLRPGDTSFTLWPCGHVVDAVTITQIPAP